MPAVEQDDATIAPTEETQSDTGLPMWLWYSIGLLVAVEILIYIGLAFTNPNPDAFPWARTLGQMFGTVVGIVLFGKLLQWLSAKVRSVGSSDTDNSFWGPRAWQIIPAVCVLLSPAGFVFGSPPFLLRGFAAVYIWVVAFAMIVQVGVNTYRDKRAA